jgi:translation initiation factor 6
MPFKFLRVNFEGDSNVGMYGFATDSYCLMGIDSSRILQKIRETLKTEVITSTVAGTDLASLFAAGNSNGILLPRIVEDFEIRKLKKLGLNYKILESRETALGNLVLCNDKGCLISRYLRNYKGEISDVLGCEVETVKIADLDIVGSCAVASNTGCLCHMEAKEEELKRIEEILKVRVDVGSVGYGSPYVKSGLIVNSNGVIFSEQSTGAEMGRIDEVFKNER